MARSKFRTHYGRGRHHPMVTRRKIRHHGFLTRFHRPVTGGREPTKHRPHAARFHVVKHGPPHPGGLIKKQTRKANAVRQRKLKTGPRLSHTKLAGRARVVSTHRKGGIHATGGRNTTRHAARHLSAAARQHLSQALKGKKHPHRGHSISAATRAKLSKALHDRLKGRPHPHRGHAMSNEARAKISRAVKDKQRSRARTRKR